LSPDERRSHVDKIQRGSATFERVVNDFPIRAATASDRRQRAVLGGLLDEVALMATTPEIKVTSHRTAHRDGRSRPAPARAPLNWRATPCRRQRRPVRRARRVKLYARVNDGEHWLSVNRGKEILPETSGKLFEPFTRRAKGTGPARVVRISR
jgi:hypothetical protein